ncbi:MAG: SAM-dependent methyltransferase [Ruminococcaceae bacterium]|nr:SAM-dependent methyltransferase [Oscillospiraceae bacterium]
MTNLSLRLKTIASLVPSGTRVCDVGTDHARLPIFLKSNNIAKSVIATDLNKKPLENAKKNVEQSGIKDISLRLGDGLSAVERAEVDTVIIAGMGGEVITGIISKCNWVKDKNLTLILQPTTSAEVLREYLVTNGFEIKSETPVSENKKLYSIMLVQFVNKAVTLPPWFYFIGKITPKDEGILYIKKQQKRVYECMTALEKIEQKQQEYKFYKTINDQLVSILLEN